MPVTSSSEHPDRDSDDSSLGTLWPYKWVSSSPTDANSVRESGVPDVISTYETSQESHVGSGSSDLELDTGENSRSGSPDTHMEDSDMCTDGGHASVYFERTDFEKGQLHQRNCDALVSDTTGSDCEDEELIPTQWRVDQGTFVLMYEGKTPEYILTDDGSTSQTPPHHYYDQIMAMDMDEPPRIYEVDSRTGALTVHIPSMSSNASIMSSDSTTDSYTLEIVKSYVDAGYLADEN